MRSTEIVARPTGVSPLNVPTRKVSGTNGTVVSKSCAPCDLVDAPQRYVAHCLVTSVSYVFGAGDTYASPLLSASAHLQPQSREAIFHFLVIAYKRQSLSQSNTNNTDYAMRLQHRTPFPSLRCSVCVIPPAVWREAFALACNRVDVA